MQDPNCMYVVQKAWGLNGASNLKSKYLMQDPNLLIIF